MFKSMACFIFLTRREVEMAISFLLLIFVVCGIEGSTGADSVRGISSSKRNTFFRHESWINHTPNSVDWRSKFGPAKDQMACGSCSVFAVIAAIEGAYQIMAGQNSAIYFSEKQILDCHGHCTGTWPNLLMDTMIKSGSGLALNHDYKPYDAEKSACQDVKAKTYLKTYEEVPARNEEALLAAVSQQPIIAHMILTDEFRKWSNVRKKKKPKPILLAVNYMDDVFRDSRRHCTQESKLTHVVTIVGYGTEKGIPFWIIRNSFGPTWGKSGFARIERGICGITTLPSVYPVLSSEGKDVCGPINPCGRGICAPTDKSGYTCTCQTNFTSVINTDGTQTCHNGASVVSIGQRARFVNGNMCTAVDFVQPYDLRLNHSKDCQSIRDRNLRISREDFFAMNDGIDCDNLQVNQQICVNFQSQPPAACPKYYVWQTGDSCLSVILRFCGSVSTWPACLGPNAGRCVGTGSSWTVGRVICVKSCLNKGRRVANCKG